jgi:DNA methylase
MAKTRKAKKAKRTVICADAMLWLANHNNLDSVVTSIPEMEELNLNYKDYIDFFRSAAALCLKATKPKGYTIFLQTDRKYKGWLDKSYLIMDEAHKLGHRMIWHKIALRTEPGKTDLYRPTYSHMLCFSQEGKIGIPIPDVIPRGTITYTHAFGLDAVRLVIQFLKQHNIKKVYDVFVGSGTTLAVANEAGLDAVGVDIDPKQCKQARDLHLGVV